MLRFISDANCGNNKQGSEQKSFLSTFQTAQLTRLSVLKAFNNFLKNRTNNFKKV